MDGRTHPACILTDSGCMASCINWGFIEARGIDTTKVPVPTAVYNVDGTANRSGQITDTTTVRLIIGNHTREIALAITQLGKVKIFLGYNWLEQHNHWIDWKYQQIKFAWCPDECRTEATIGVRAHMTVATELTTRADQDWDARLKEAQIPIQYHEFLPTVFSKEKFDKLPQIKEWDHTIKLIPNATLSDCKTYPLSKEEQKELDMFLKENLESGHIRPLKSPMASPLFFAKKRIATYNQYRIVEN